MTTAVEEEEEVVATGCSSINNKNVIVLVSDLSHTDLQILDRLGVNLRLYADNRTAISDTICLQVMNDFAHVKREIIGSDMEKEEDVYWHLLVNFFDGNQCNAAECASLNNNSRIRFSECNESSVMNTMDAIHCAVIHGYDSGQKITREERRRMMERNGARKNHNINNNSDESDDNNDSDDDDEDDGDTLSFIDNELNAMREMINQRMQGQQNNRAMEMRQRMNGQIASKFVTEVVEEEDEEEKSNINNNSDNNNGEEEEQKKQRPVYRCV